LDGFDADGIVVVVKLRIAVVINLLHFARGTSALVANIGDIVWQKEASRWNR
jgi:hypothetical protein